MQNQQSDFFTNEGTPYSGEVFESDQGFSFGEGVVSCPACGGNGTVRRRTCGRCGGSKEIFDQFKVYSAPQYAKLSKARDRRKSSKQNEEIRRQAAIREGHLDYVETHREIFEKAAAEKDNGFLQDLVAKSEVYGGLTDAQTSAMRSVVESLDASRILHANSKPLGKVGDEIEVDLVCTSCRTVRKPNFMKTDMEDLHVTEMADESGNAVVVLSKSFRLEPGEAVRLSGMVREIDDRRGYARTRLVSPKVLEPSPNGGMNP